MKNGFLKVAAGTPALKVADPAYNVQQITAMMQEAHRCGIKLLVLPELSLTGYTCGDLLLQSTLQKGALAALEEIRNASLPLGLTAVVGLPLSVHDKLYNCAAVVSGGKVLGIVPKSNIPNYGEFYEARWFTPAPRTTETVTLAGEEIPFGTDLLFCCREMPEYKLAVEICEDLWVPASPSVRHAAAGATVIANLSASDEIIGKAAYRRQLVSGQSGKL